MTQQPTNEAVEQEVIKKIESLTPEQEARMIDYLKRGIEIGLKTGGDFDEKLVRELTDAHRVMHGVAAATEFLVYDSPAAVIQKYTEEPYKATPDNALYGQHDISWLMFFEFFRQEFGFVKETDPVQNLFQLAQHVGWMWMDETRTIITRRPEELHMKDSGKKLEPSNLPLLIMHNDSGPAIRYRDGWGLYVVDGNVVGVAPIGSHLKNS